MQLPVLLSYYDSTESSYTIDQSGRRGRCLIPYTYTFVLVIHVRPIDLEN